MSDCIAPPDTERLEQVEKVNADLARASDGLPWDHPVKAVKWIHLSRIRANDYNPNSVAHHEMRLLHTSISEDGYTMPVVCIWDPDATPLIETIDPATGTPYTGCYIIVDGFHRYTTMRLYQDIYDSTGGFLPVAVIDKPIADRMASTVRHNRARGEHSVKGMGSMVFNMLKEGESDSTICNKLGMEAEELARLKHVTGYSKLYSDQEYSRPVLTSAQAKAKSDYKKEHPDEQIPSHF